MNSQPISNDLVERVPAALGVSVMPEPAWTLIGSSKWDSRSLELNFEFNVECYDAELRARMDAFFAERGPRQWTWSCRPYLQPPWCLGLTDLFEGRAYGGGPSGPAEGFC